MLSTTPALKLVASHGRWSNSRLDSLTIGVSRKVRKVILCLLAASIAQWLAAVCAGNRLPAQTVLAATPQSRSDEVTITVTVTNKQGYVTGLSRADFSVFAGKTPLEITSFSFGEEPMSIGIVYDKSRSSNDKYNNGVAVSKIFRDALGRFLQLSNPSNDYLSAWQKSPSLWSTGPATIRRCYQHLKI